jgi:hypothetical protein
MTLIGGLFKWPIFWIFKQPNPILIMKNPKKLFFQFCLLLCTRVNDAFGLILCIVATAIFELIIFWATGLVNIVSTEVGKIPMPVMFIFCYLGNLLIFMVLTWIGYWQADKAEKVKSK